MLNLKGVVIEKTEWSTQTEYKSYSDIIDDLLEVDGNVISREEAQEVFFEWLAVGSVRVIKLHGKYIVSENVSF